jgi:beta-N-acetylhexosaminidase
MPLTGAAWVAAALVAAAPTPIARGEAAPTTRELLGQRLVVAVEGLRPSTAIVGRIRRGEIGGVILFGANVTSPSQLRNLTSELQRAARESGRPPLLIATDQEGGSVRRLPWAGPARPAPELGRSSASDVRNEALLAGRALRVGGVNVDLAPVADVPAGGSFMAAEERTFGAAPPLVSRAVTAFTRGLADASVAAAVKHFPGIGRAGRNTDRSAVEIAASRAALQSDLAPFKAAIAAGAPIVMISNASYPAIDDKPAPWSPKVQALLRRALGFEGVTITDALDGAAATRGRAVASVTVLAAQAGVDLLLLTGSEASSERAYERLVAAAAQGRIPAASIRRSHDRIMALKRIYAGTPAR